MSYEQAAAERLLNHHGDADAPTRYAKRRASALGGVLLSVRPRPRPVSPTRATRDRGPVTRDSSNNASIPPRPAPARLARTPRLTPRPPPECRPHAGFARVLLRPRGARGPPLRRRHSRTTLEPRPRGPDQHPRIRPPRAVLESARLPPGRRRRGPLRLPRRVRDRRSRPRRRADRARARRRARARKVRGVQSPAHRQIRRRRRRKSTRAPPPRRAPPPAGVRPRRRHRRASMQHPGSLPRRRRRPGRRPD